MSTPVRAVLFDLDGTLVDSQHVTAAALRIACAEGGVAGEPPVQDFLAMSGCALEDILDRLGLPAELARGFRAAASRMVDCVRPHPGAPELLVDLRNRGVRIGIITGKDRPRTEAVLARTAIAGLVDAVVTPNDPPAAKPSPEGVSWLCEQLRVRAGEAVLVGDSVVDIRAGNGAGVRTIACLWGTGSADFLNQHRPWRVVARFEELARLLHGLTDATALCWAQSRSTTDAGSLGG